MARKKVLFFSPFALVWHQAVIEAKLVSIIDDEYEIINLTCSGMFSSACTAIKAVGGAFTETPGESCAACTKNASILAKRVLGTSQIKSLENLLADTEILEIKSLINQFSLEEKLFYCEDNFELGKVALYEVLNSYKKIDFNLNSDEEKYYDGCLLNVILLKRAAERILKEVKPDIVISHAPFYSGTSMLAQVSIKLEIPTYFIDGSNNISERKSAVRIWEINKYGFFPPAYRTWENNSGKFVAKQSEIKRIGRHIEATKSSTSFSVYSPKPKNLSSRETFSINQSDNIVLACLSSHDEYFADLTAGFIAKEDYISRVYPDQINWIEALIKWVNTREGIQLIIRLHPREFPNRRESQVSERGLIWEKLLKDLPKNVHIDHPNMQFALHDHFKEITVLTTGWSTTGLEALTEGIPVVTYDENLVKYPRLIHLSGKSEEEYFRNLERCLKTPRPNNLSEEAIKYQIFHHIRGSVYVRGQIKYLPYIEIRTVIRKALSFLERYLPNQMKKFDTFVPVPRSEKKKMRNMIRNQDSSLNG